MNNGLNNRLDTLVAQYNRPNFIKDDPISIPHRFTKLQDVEISAFFASILAWGNRTMIINSCNRLMNLMDNAPYDFIINHNEQDLKRMLGFVHRTYNATDLLYFIAFMQHHYQEFHSLQTAFSQFMHIDDADVEPALIGFRNYFFSLDFAPERTFKHIATPAKKSACKRINMFLRWMVRKDDRGVDFGIWNEISPAQLMCPLDIHVSRTARQFGLLQRKQDDWQAVKELTQSLKALDAEDPIKYDFALFGLGAIGE